MVASATTTPPGTTASRNFSSEGWFMTTSMFGSTTSGDPTGSSDSVTEQLAVPPRISGPYEGSHETSRPSMRPA